MSDRSRSIFESWLSAQHSFWHRIGGGAEAYCVCCDARVQSQGYLDRFGRRAFPKRAVCETCRVILKRNGVPSSEFER